MAGVPGSESAGVQCGPGVCVSDTFQSGGDAGLGAAFEDLGASLHVRSNVLILYNVVVVRR